MSDDPFAPPDPYGDGSHVDLELDVDTAPSPAERRAAVPEGSEVSAEASTSCEPITPRQPKMPAKEPAPNNSPGCFRCRNRDEPLVCCPGCGTTAAEFAAAGPPEVYHGIQAEAALERRLLIWAPPVVFALGFLLMFIGGDGFVRVVFGMWLHELGHAVSAWLTGHFAVPGPWKTQIDAEQSIKVTLAIFAGLGFLAFRAWQAERTITLYVLGSIALLTLICTFGVSERNAQTAITFFGDAGMMIMGGALVLTFWAKPGTHIHTSWLRWGYLVIGALAYLDGVFTWWPARKDPSVIPYGEIEGVGLSDATKLIDVAGWSQQQLIDRYAAVIMAVAVILVARWAYGLWRIRHEMPASARLG
ncbi:MAG: hypothetical protein GY811_11525 [Myxococcales bacterium]|nr:hypothetical protein [Myxococcales bacterium]